MPLEETISQIAALPRLTELKLNLLFDFEEEDVHDDQILEPKCHQLRGVTKLRLNLFHSPITVDHFAATFSKLFPALENIEIYTDQSDFVKQLDQRIFGFFAKLQSYRLVLRQ